MRSAVPSGAPKQPRQHDDEDELGQDRDDQEHQHEEPVRDDLAEVEKHAHGHEEEAEQHVAERLDVLLDLVAVLGFRDEHAGEESSEREREARELGQRGEPERDEQQVQHEELGALLSRDDVEPRAHRRLAGEQDDHQHHRRLEHRDDRARP